MIVCFTSCICVFCQTIRYTCIPLESFAFHANLYMDSFVFRDMYVYLMFDKSYIYLEMKFVLNEKKIIHVFEFMFNFMYMSILSKLLDIHVYPFEPRAFNAYIICGLFVFGYVCIL